MRVFHGRAACMEDRGPGGKGSDATCGGRGTAYQGFFSASSVVVGSLIFSSISPLVCSLSAPPKFIFLPVLAS